MSGFFFFQKRYLAHSGNTLNHMTLKSLWVLRLSYQTTIGMWGWCTGWQLSPVPQADDTTQSRTPASKELWIQAEWDQQTKLTVSDRGEVGDVRENASKLTKFLEPLDGKLTWPEGCQEPSCDRRKGSQGKLRAESVKQWQDYRNNAILAPETEKPWADPDSQLRPTTHTEYFHLKLTEHKAGEELCSSGALATHTGKHCFTLTKCEARQLSWPASRLQATTTEAAHYHQHPNLIPVFSLPRENGSPGHFKCPLRPPSGAAVKKNGYPGCLVWNTVGLPLEQGLSNWVLEQQRLDRAMVKRKEGRKSWTELRWAEREVEERDSWVHVGWSWKMFRAKGVMDSKSITGSVVLCSVFWFGLVLDGRSTELHH